MSVSTRTPAPRALTRRQFSVDAALAILAGCVITVAEGCGSKSSPTAPTPADIAAEIAANHTPPHTVTVTGAQIVAGNAVTLTLVGAATHNHTVTLSQADLLSLKNKQVVTTTSTTDANHSHATTFRPV
jgi:hypothetical protein